MYTENKIIYYVDKEKAKQKSNETGKRIEPRHPVIKNVGLFSDAGIDLFAAHDFVIPPHDYVVVDSFVGVFMPSGVAGLLWPRGGDEFLLGSGVVDTGYTGTIKAKIINPYNKEMRFGIGDSIGQLVLFVKGVHSSPELQEVDRDTGLQSKQKEQVRGDDGRINNSKKLY